MQRIQGYGLLGVSTPAQNVNTAPGGKIAQRGSEGPAIAIPARRLTLADAEQITKSAPSAGNTVPATASSSFPPERFPAGVRAAQRYDGRQWISEARAAIGNLPPGNYVWRDGHGNIHRQDVGETACNRGKLSRRYRTALRDVNTDAVNCREFGRGGTCELR